MFPDWSESIDPEIPQGYPWPPLDFKVTGADEEYAERLCPYLATKISEISERNTEVAWLDALYKLEAE